MKNICVIFLLSFILFLCSYTTGNRKPGKFKTIVIDAGHGGKDIGCHGKRTKEAHIALAVALAVGEKIKANMPDIKVIYTRSKDEFIELHDRAGIANKNHADLFISIHCNAAPSHVFGSETYTMGLHKTEGNLEVAQRENEVVLKEDDFEKNYGGFDPNSPMAYILFANYQNAFMAKSVKFASYIERQFTEELGRYSRGVKQAGFLVLWKTSMPSALIELGYLTNEEEENFLKNPANQDNYAKAIYAAVLKYKEEIN